MLTTINIALISIFTLDGRYVSKFGTGGTSEGHLKYPSGLTIDTMMYSFILVEYDNNCVSIFNKDRVFVHCALDAKVLLQEN